VRDLGSVGDVTPTDQASSPPSSCTRRLPLRPPLRVGGVLGCLAVGLTRRSRADSPRRTAGPCSTGLALQTGVVGRVAERADGRQSRRSRFPSLSGQQRSMSAPSLSRGLDEVVAGSNEEERHPDRPQARSHSRHCSAASHHSTVRPIAPPRALAGHRPIGDRRKKKSTPNPANVPPIQRSTGVVPVRAMQTPLKALIAAHARSEILKGGIPEAMPRPRPPTDFYACAWGAGLSSGSSAHALKCKLRAAAYVCNACAGFRPNGITRLQVSNRRPPRFAAWRRVRHAEWADSSRGGVCAIQSSCAR
jgi:hypothetical protein